MRNIFSKNKIYFESEINRIATENGLCVVDCLKDENMISLEKWNNGDGEDCLFEFNMIKEGQFLMRWSKFNN